MHRRRLSIAGAAETRHDLRFDLSDLQPTAFGATAGAGLWRAFQDFLANPTDVAGAAAAMEAEAVRLGPTAGRSG